MAEITWSSLLQKHFIGRKWKKYHKNIVFYMLCINFGLKPSFMWDFGPESLTPMHLSNFLQDLKLSSLICDNIIVVTFDGNNFIANRNYLLDSLKKTHILMDITKTEKEWVLTKTNVFLVDILDRLKFIQKSAPNGIFSLQLRSDDCLPSIFGLMLGYPVIYYFSFTYPNFSVSLILYKVWCRFKFLNISDDFSISSFSIPETLFSNEVKITVNEWFHNLKNVNAVMFQGLKIEHSSEYVNSLNL